MCDKIKTANYKNIKDIEQVNNTHLSYIEIFS